MVNISWLCSIWDAVYNLGLRDIITRWAQERTRNLNNDSGGYTLAKGLLSCLEHELDTNKVPVAGPEPFLIIKVVSPELISAI